MQLFVARHIPLLVFLGVMLGQLLVLSLQITRGQNVRLIHVWAETIFDPFEREMRAVVDATSNSWQTYRGLWHAQAENRELKTELVSAQGKIQQLSDQAQELQRLRALLDFKNQLSYQTIAAEVIAASPGENSNAITIDKGMDSGLTADMAVITPRGIVGKTLTVFSRTSKVLLITDPESGAGVALAKSRTQGVLKGSGSGQCKMDYVMNEEHVAPGDAVVTSGLDQIYPKELPVGIVVISGNGNIYKNIIVRPVAELTRLETVLVVVKPLSRQEQASNSPPR
jgi:rod shape-determining protein MreC